MVPGTETRYLPYGTHRLAPTTQLTERDYTGQKENLELGLLYYNARFYLPGIGRFASADTIVPDVTRPQSANRYSYVENRPTLMVDPSGHLGICFQQGQNNSETDTALSQMCEELAGKGVFGPNRNLFKVFESSPEGAKAALEWLNEILAQDQYANEEVFLFGFSYGGAAAIEFAWLLNDRGGKSYMGVDVPNRHVSGLITVDPVSSYREITGWLIYSPYSSSGSTDGAYAVPNNVNFALNLYATDDILPIGCAVRLNAPDCGKQNIDGALNVAMTGTNHCSIGYKECSTPSTVGKEYLGVESTLGPLGYQVYVSAGQNAPANPSTINLIRIHMLRNTRHHGYVTP
ncbi:MAG: RHS repeat-associated core domain-containing protein [Anaerolineae bacterium]|nr:RHS repeat-associated core domain-containing protein [Anaerolineae bacterium]